MLGVFLVISYLILLVWAVVGVVKAWPKAMGSHDKAMIAQRAQAVRASGPLLGKENCGAIVGRLAMWPPVFEVEVYPGGLVIHTFLTPPVAIRAAELITITTIRKFTVQPGWRSQTGKLTFLWRGTEIIHSSPDIASPILLDISAKSGVAVALSYFIPAPQSSCY